MVLGWVCGFAVRLKGRAFGFGCAQGDYSRAILRVVVAQGAWLRVWWAGFWSGLKNVIGFIMA